MFTSFKSQIDFNGSYQRLKFPPWRKLERASEREFIIKIIIFHFASEKGTRTKSKYDYLPYFPKGKSLYFAFQRHINNYILAPS